MRHIRRLALVAVAMSLVTGCASGGGGGAQTGATRGSRDLIVSAELEEGEFTNVLEAVQRLRPTWLRPRGATSTRTLGSSGVVVYINNVRAGGLSRLESMPVDMVKELRYVDSREATFRWGTGHTGGAIEVISKASGRP